MMVTDNKALADRLTGMASCITPGGLNDAEIALMREAAAALTPPQADKARRAACMLQQLRNDANDEAADAIEDLQLALAEIRAEFEALYIDTIAATDKECDRLQLQVERVRAEVAMWRKDDDGHLADWGQHHPASLVCLADRIDAALNLEPDNAPERSDEATSA